MRRVWIADDEPSVRFVLAEALSDAHFEPRVFDSAEALLAALADGRPEVVFTDLRMPGADGLALLRQIKAQAPELPVILISAYTDIASTSAAFADGAFDFLSKPFDLDDAVALAQRALGASHAADESPAQPAAADSAATPELLGESAVMRQVFRAIGRVAPTRANVLITGQTGTGKELVARALHRHSRRALGPFVALNTAAIPAELLESELFGHEAGAFTGAQRRHIGRFEQASGGSLFLDEIGDMPQSLQTRLLRVLAEGEFYRVGGRELMRADVRLIAATHQELEAQVAAGKFRADLMHRLDVIRIALPALAQRRGDVPLLAEHLLGRVCAELGSTAKRFDRSALDALRAADWPGNVRQLENLCRRLAVLAPGTVIGPAELRAVGFDWQQASPTHAADGVPMWQLELESLAQAELAAGRERLYATAHDALDRALFAAALEHTGGHREKAAKLLGIGRNTLGRKLGTSRARRSGSP